MGNRRRARIIAFQALYWWDVGNTTPEKLLSLEWLDEELLAESSAAAADTRKDSRQGLNFARLLIAGTIENIDQIDRHIQGQLQHWDFRRLGRVDLAILRVSVYALLFQPDIPSSVTIDEAINIAREFGSEESYRFVNGVLDGIRKEHSETRHRA